MRVYEIVLTESKQTANQLDEGPIATALARGAATAGKALAKGATKGAKALGKGAAALGKGALKAAPAVGQAIGSTVGSTVGGVAGGLVRGFKGAKAGQTGYEEPTSAAPSSASSAASAPSASGSSSAASAPATKMNLLQMQQAALNLRNSDRQKLLAFLQANVKPAASASPAAPARVPRSGNVKIGKSVKPAAAKPAVAV